jgi:FkbM family methyltransferase
MDRVEMNAIAKLAKKIERRISPMREVMSAAEYRSVAKTPPFTEGRTNLFGTPVEFSNTEGYLHSVQEIFYGRVYEFKAKTDRPFIVDAGANIGLSVIYFKRLYPNASIVAYEPDPQMFALLQRNIASFGFADVDLRRAAAWVDDVDLTFYREGSLAGSTEVDFLEKGDKVVVPAERLKTLLTDRHIDFLKIDIEGGENTVLFDIEAELANVDALFFEYHSLPGKDQKLGELLSLVTRAGFRFMINGIHGPWYPFIERKMDGFDFQANVSCFRI